MKFFCKRTFCFLFVLVLALGLAPAFAFNVHAEEVADTTEKQTYEESLSPVTIVNGDYTFTINKTVFEVGEEIIVSASGPNPTDWVGFYKGAADSATHWNFVDSVGDGVKYNLISTVSDSLTEGEYIIRLQANDSSNPSDTKATVKIKIGNPETGVTGDKTALSTDKAVYKVGEPVMVTATATTSTSWVGMYRYNHYTGPSYKWHWVDVQNPGGNEYSAPGSGMAYDVTRGEELLPGYYTINLFPDSATNWDAVVASTTIFVESSCAISYESIVGDDGENSGDNNGSDSGNGDTEEDKPNLDSKCALTFTNGSYSLTINKTRFEVGEAIYISAKGIEGNKDWVGIYALNGNSPILKQVVDNVGHGETYDLRTNYSELNDPSLKDLPEGEYIIRLQADDKTGLDGTKVLVKIKIGNPETTVFGDSTLLSVDKSTYEQGEPIMVTPHMVEGYDDSWVGIYQFGKYFENNSIAWEWVKTNGSGNAYDVTEGISLNPGAYLIMLFPYDTGDMSTCVAYTSIVVENDHTKAWNNIEDPVHNYKYSNSYEDGYMNSGKHVYKCTDCGMPKEEDAPALFTCQGYSAPEDGSGAVVIKFTVHAEAILEYEGLTGKTVKYGLFAASKNTLGTGDILDENGNAINGSIKADVSDTEYVALTLKMVGFDTDESKEAKFAIGAYVETTLDGNKEFSYLQVGTPAENEKYCFISHNDIYKSNQ